MIPENTLHSNTGEFALSIADHISAMIAYWDKDLICRFANNAYVEWFGKTKEEMIDRMHISELLGPIYEKNLPYIKGALSGEKQLFEREIPTPDGKGIRHSLATYLPEIINDEVKGFFVHVADVSYIKNLEKELIISKRNFLRQAIETEENEKRYLVEILRESINQKLAVCKMMLPRAQNKNQVSDSDKDLSSLLVETINDINKLCQNLTPTEIEILGLRESIELYCQRFSSEKNLLIDLNISGDDIERIAIKDKLSVFRIIQYFFFILQESPASTAIEVTIIYLDSKTKITFSTDTKIDLNLNSKEYNSILCRIDYYSGNIFESFNDNIYILEIELSFS
ncbi:MAG: PAS domain-containing protein [Bacteroidetes bacterium]|nr:PAS domain-containing protein [Bacteroidota bacterium]